MSSYETDNVWIDGLELSVSRSTGELYHARKGRAFGLCLSNREKDVLGWFTVEEALQIRDYINEHFGDSDE